MDDQEAIAAQAIEAYEAIAERFAEHSETSAHNAFCERPATLSLLPEVRGMRVLDAGCGPGFYTERLWHRDPVLSPSAERYSPAASGHRFLHRADRRSPSGRGVPAAVSEDVRGAFSTAFISVYPGWKVGAYPSHLAR